MITILSYLTEDHHTGMTRVGLVTVGSGAREGRTGMDRAGGLSGQDKHPAHTI